MRRFHVAPSVSRVFIVLMMLLIAVPSEAGDEKGGKTVTAAVRGECTSACIVNNGYAVIGSNYDSGWTGGYIFFNKRGISKSNRFIEPEKANPTVLQWTSKYASVIFSVGIYQYPWAGMNERGLAYGTMALEEHVPDVSDPRALMASSFWWQYVLDTCETVEEVMATDLLVKLDTVDHFLFTDRYGNAAVVEFQNGHMVFYTGDELDVAALTNDPYISCRDNWNQYAHTSNDYSNMTDSNMRFCIAADRVDDFTSRSDQGAVDYMFGILSATGWPDRSTWSIVFDTKNLKVHYNTIYDRTMRYIDLLSFDLSGKMPAKMIAVHTPLRGNITASMYNIDWQVIWDSAINRLAWEGEEIPIEYVRQAFDEMKRFSWTGDKTAEGWSVSPTAGKTVDSVRCALNPDTGNVLVTWCERNASSCQVKSALIYKTLDGTYCAAERYTLSMDDSWKGNPYPAYISTLGKFLVVWDRADPAKPTTASGIYGTFVSGSGLPSKQVVSIVGGRKHCEAPQVYERLGDASSPADAASIDMVYFTAKAGKKQIKKPSLNIASLDGSMRVQKDTAVINGETKKKVPEVILPRGMGAVVEKTIVLPVECEDVQDDGSLIHYSKLISINENNALASEEIIGNAGNTTPRLGAYFGGSGQAVVVGSSLDSSGKYTNCLFTMAGDTGILAKGKAYGEKRKSVDLCSLMLNEQASSSTPPAKKPIGYQFSATTDGCIYRRNISATGKLTGGYVKFVGLAKGIDGVAATQLAQSGAASTRVAAKVLNMLVFWHSASSLDKSEIRMQAMSVTR